MPGWTNNPRAVADAARWQHRLAQLVDFREEGNDWPHHHDYGSEYEHALGLWIHASH